MLIYIIFTVFSALSVYTLVTFNIKDYCERKALIKDYAELMEFKKRLP